MPSDFSRRMTPGDALEFVRRHGVVLQAARGPVPSLAEAVAGGPIHGSWWGHPKGHEIFAASEAVIDSGEVLVCKLVEGKVTYVHRRLWPALVKLAPRFAPSQLAKVWSEHTASGAHVKREVPFPGWVPADVRAAADGLAIDEAAAQMASWLSLAGSPRSARGGAPRAARRRSPGPRSARGSRGLVNDPG